MCCVCMMCLMWEWRLWSSCWTMVSRLMETFSSTNTRVFGSVSSTASGRGSGRGSDGGSSDGSGSGSDFGSGEEQTRKNSDTG